MILNIKNTREFFLQLKVWEVFCIFKIKYKIDCIWSKINKYKQKYIKIKLHSGCDAICLCYFGLIFTHLLTKTGFGIIAIHYSFCLFNHKY